MTTPSIFVPPRSMPIRCVMRHHYGRSRHAEWRPQRSPMPRFKLTIEYAGTRYSGWQIQTNARTIQDELVKAVREATGRDRFEVYKAGRTDADVHALAQVAHLDVGTALPPAALLARINDTLP